MRKRITDLFKRLTGQDEEGAAAAVRSEQASRFLRWAVYSPRNATITVIVVFLTGMAGFTAVSMTTAYKVDKTITASKAEALAKQQAAEAANGGPGKLDAAEEMAKALERPTTSAAAPTDDGHGHDAEPSHTQPGTFTPAPPSNPAAAKQLEAAPQKAAQGFLKVWLAAKTYKDQKAWVDALRPYVTQDVINLVELSNRAYVPDMKLVEMTSVTTVPTSRVTALFDNQGVLGISLQQEKDGRWLVTQFAPEAGL